jgi:ribosomal protein S18 acetylase RimI-like enzyme
MPSGKSGQDDIFGRRDLMGSPMTRTNSFRPARIADAAVLAELVNYAGEGLPLYLWGKLVSASETAWDVGRLRAARETGSFSYRNATIIEHEGQAAGSLIGYAIPEIVDPMPPDMPAMFVPLQELENLAPGTWYVNVLAVLPSYRSLGYGTEMLRFADNLGCENGCRGMSVIVSNANSGAQRLYERLGYTETAKRTMVQEGWVNDGTEWVLLTKMNA